ncbi:hypothetical protein BJ546DRAFT_34126 [Cryomyces antarcticus]
MSCVLAHVVPIDSVPLSSGPGIISHPYNNAYFCCSCGYGPMVIAWHPACIGCSRVACGSCSWTHLDEHDVDGQAHTAASFTLAPEHIQESGLAFDDEEHRQHTNVTRCRPRPIESHYLTLYITTHGETSPAATDDEERWFCCLCLDGPKNLLLEPVCVRCQHPPCDYCTGSSA